MQNGICPSFGSGSGGLKNDNIYAYFHKGTNVNWLMVGRLRNKIYIPFHCVLFVQPYYPNWSKKTVAGAQT